CITIFAEEKVISLYRGAAPGSENWPQEEKESRTNLWNKRFAFNVARPTLTAVIPEPERAVGTAVIICPGGGFHALSIYKDWTGAEKSAELHLLAKGDTLLTCANRTSRRMSGSNYLRAGSRTRGR